MSLINASQPNALREEDRQRLRRLLIAGSVSMPAASAVNEYFTSLRTRAQKARDKSPPPLFQH